MRRLASGPNTLELGNLRNVLEMAGIRAEIRNLDRAAGMLQIPIAGLEPELWLIDDHRYEEAVAIVRRVRTPLTLVVEPWICPACGESVDGDFAACWNCGRST